MKKTNNKPERILVLGGGRHQINIIEYAENSGIEVVLSDYLKESPGHEFATYSTLTSTYDAETNIEIAKKYNVSGVITSGTDQPLNTMAKVAEALNLKCYLTPERASICTNKIPMLKCLSTEKLNIPRYLVVEKSDIKKPKFEGFNFPLIVKPVDSQGQRGITILTDASQYEEAYQRAKIHSSDESVIIQEYVTGPEITITAWIHEGKGQTLLVTDRVTYNKNEAVGVCLKHVYPSKNISGIEDQVQEAIEKIANAYQLKNGPLYIQAIRKNDVLSIVEATCRLGGGHEDLLLKEVTGIEIYPHLISLALHGKSTGLNFNQDFPIPNKFVTVCFLISKEGSFHSQIIDDSNFDDYGYVRGGFYYKDGHVQKKIVNSLGRIAYFICESDSRKLLDENCAKIYQQFKIYDESNNNLIFWPTSEYLNGE